MDFFYLLLIMIMLLNGPLLLNLSLETVNKKVKYQLSSKYVQVKPWNKTK